MIFYHLKKSKKNKKNVKFGLQARFNMDIMLNGLDRLFGLLNTNTTYKHIVLKYLLKRLVSLIFFINMQINHTYL